MRDSAGICRSVFLQCINLGERNGVLHDRSSAADLLRRAGAGESEVRYREFVKLLVRSRGARQMKGRLDSSDLVQETLFQAARHIRQFQGECEQEWRAWLTRIAEREVIRQLRRHLGAEKRDVKR